MKRQHEIITWEEEKSKADFLLNFAKDGRTYINKILAEDSKLH